MKISVKVYKLKYHFFLTGVEQKSTGNSNNRIEMNINKNMQGIKSKDDFIKIER